MKTLRSSFLFSFLFAFSYPCLTLHGDENIITNNEVPFIRKTYTFPKEYLYSWKQEEKSMPVIIGDVLWAASSRSYGVFLIDKNTGKKIKKIKTEGVIETSLLHVKNNSNIISGDTSGYLYSYSLNGKTRWKTYVGEPVLVDFILIENTVILQLPSGKIIGIDENKGTILWTYHKEFSLDFYKKNDYILPPLFRIKPTPIKNNENKNFAVVQNNDLSLSVINIENGNVLFTDEISYLNNIQKILPILDNHHIIILSTSGEIESYSFENNVLKRHWELSVKKDIDDILYDETNKKLYYSLRNINDVKSISAIDGKELWSWNYNKRNTTIKHLSYVADKNKLYIMSSDGFFIELNTSTGDVVNKKFIYDVLNSFSQIKFAYFYEKGFSITKNDGTLSFFSIENPHL